MNPKKYVAYGQTTTIEFLTAWGPSNELIAPVIDPYLNITITEVVKVKYQS